MPLHTYQNLTTQKTNELLPSSEDEKSLFIHQIISSRTFSGRLHVIATRSGIRPLIPYSTAVVPGGIRLITYARHVRNLFYSLSLLTYYTKLFCNFRIQEQCCKNILNWNVND